MAVAFPAPGGNTVPVIPLRTPGMITETIPMWTSQRTLVPLRDVLELFPPNNWRWTVEEFDGMFGRLPTDITWATWARFQEMVATGAVVFDWNGIQQFADSVDQMIEGRIVATDENDSTVVQLDAFDSSEYQIVIDPAWSGAAAVVSAVRSEMVPRQAP
ncbi:hypothetical protein NDR87_32935 [Nocardia sp. CDC159]|uniref:Uncharacterized protein n=1 Tax=Nocardia pulmonis TaxID=2951408 RepID=A0A9X2EDN4_9NOCA|nr:MULTISPECIES: hypothetical protein [Nocardia]MCM6778415.1 hypothetical protein [Nocardia pulmonis]MCM6791189.1 hypothetical protein [Nocardia sp. CDC159]